MQLDSEKELEDYLCGQRDEHGFEDIVTYGHYDLELRQLAIGNYGIADIVRIKFNKDHISVQIVELKKDSINIDALVQIAKYRKGLGRYLAKVAPGVHVIIDGVLVGSRVSDSKDFCYLIDQIGWLDVYSYELTLHSGIEFEPQKGWQLTNEDFTSLKTGFRAVKSEYLQFLRCLKDQANVIELSSKERA